MVQVVSEARVSASQQIAGPLILAAAVLTTAIPASAAAPTVQTGSTDQEIHLDGTLDEPAWQQAGVIPNLAQQDPHPGEPTPFTTEVRVLVDATTIYIGFVCHDPDPSRIAIHTMQRDGNMRGDDTVTVVLDPIADGRRGYYFEINAAAARLDGLISGAEEMSTDWDGIWDAATQRTPGGWSAEIRIPAQTLRFKWGQDHWGFNVQRYVPRTLTTLRWSGITLDATLWSRRSPPGPRPLTHSLRPHPIGEGLRERRAHPHGRGRRRSHVELHRRPHGLSHYQPGLRRDRDRQPPGQPHPFPALLPRETGVLSRGLGHFRVRVRSRS